MFWGEKMLYEEINNEAISLGFRDREEMLLYQDICGFDIIPTFDKDELLSRCYDESRGRSKDEFIDYMNEHNLMSIYDRVKSLSTYERFMELYNSYNNEFVLANFMLGKYNDKFREASELFDGEKQEEAQRMRKILYSRLAEIEARKNNLEISALYRLEGEEQENFYKYVEEIKDYMYEINKKGKGRKH